MQKYIVVAVVLVCVASKKIQSLKEQEAHGDVPPPPKHNGSNAMKKLAENSIGTRTLWNPNGKQKIWQLSGLREGDIMEDELESRNVYREGIANFWPGAVVPYFISPHINETQKDMIRGAMDEIQKKSCVRFRPYIRGERDFITIKNDEVGCWSYPGRKEGGQNLNLFYLCFDHATVVHEILHALGFIHQHSAPNRDEYISINLDNVLNKNKTYAFNKFEPFHVTDYGLPYDYLSVMHYDQYAFSVNETIPTIIPLKPGITGEMLGSSKGLSDIDRKKLNIMYNCKL